MAMLYLMDATSRPDASATAHFLLGSQFAQAQLTEQAMQELEAAVAMDPSLAIARFQLGLLLLCAGKVGRSAEMLRTLASEGGSDALNCFACGLLHLIRDEFAESARYLNEGIRLNAKNDALNKDMQKILDEIERSLLQQKNIVSTLAETPSTQHLFLSAYTGKPTH